MMDLWTSLTKQEGEIEGELKPILSEPDLEKLRRNPFHITQSNIQVRYQCSWFLYKPSMNKLQETYKKRHIL